MATATIQSALEIIGKLKPDDQDMVMDIVRKRRAEQDRLWIAKYAKKVRRDIASGKLKPEPLDKMLERLHQAADDL